MSTKVVVPQLGQSIVEATIIRWLKNPGDHVEKGEPLVEIGTDKINTELPSPSKGILTQLLADVDAVVPVGAEIAVIEEQGAAQSGEKKKDTSDSSAPSETLPPSIPHETHSSRIHSSPYVRKLARENDIDLKTISGTGSGGRITKDDILKVIASSEGASGIARESFPERVPLTRMRKLIAEHMMLSKRTSADVTTFFEVDMHAVAKEREKAKPVYENEYGLRLSYLPFIMTAVIKALRKYRVLNSSMEPDAIIYHNAVHLGIAVAVDQGLLVPVIRNAEEKNILGLTRAAQDLAERARAGKLQPQDLEDGTFTITNPGVFGALMGTPIIHQPQAAILGVGAVVKRAVVINDAIAIRPMSYFSLTYDHRVLDGATADQFLAHVKSILENECPPALS